jgi:hypothetical protein
VQEPQLRDDEEQEDDAGAAGVQQVLPSVPPSHGTQRDEVNDECGVKNDELKTASSNSSFFTHRSKFLAGV